MCRLLTKGLIPNPSAVFDISYKRPVLPPSSLSLMERAFAVRRFPSCSFPPISAKAVPGASRAALAGTSITVCRVPARMFFPLLNTRSWHWSWCQQGGVVGATGPTRDRLG
ncbi:hypothetical protein AAFF_G00430660 [Aldrovandia affinis]|uniref:Uncharacterized protein n=1 Tax=Aldrovandia affinis TaxID=143900 RepID=A0AAD7S8Z4_9TELE|nr:hypothetical protein AAFF_G00430660 [Aldrovandia affinis]